MTPGWIFFDGIRWPLELLLEQPGDLYTAQFTLSGPLAGYVGRFSLIDMKGNSLGEWGTITIGPLAAYDTCTYTFLVAREYVRERVSSTMKDVLYLEDNR